MLGLDRNAEIHPGNARGKARHMLVLRPGGPLFTQLFTWHMPGEKQAARARQPGKNQVARARGVCDLATWFLPGFCRVPIRRDLVNVGLPGFALEDVGFPDHAGPRPESTWRKPGGLEFTW